ncbi:MAG: hypothetical protein DRP09_13000 [Candidatus Thorarchaeota archaeon]|nr:MAG: hypothetical protein DRP09_13000 [Candidatus Thorarchaeota archaeon]
MGKIKPLSSLRNCVFKIQKARKSVLAFVLPGGKRVYRPAIRVNGQWYYADFEDAAQTILAGIEQDKNPPKGYGVPLVGAHYIVVDHGDAGLVLRPASVSEVEQWQREGNPVYLD